MSRGAPLAAALVALLAGCTGVPAPLDAAPMAGPTGPAVWTHTWSGSVPVGLAYELPAHYPETAALASAVFGPGMRPIHVEETPEALVVDMDWTGAPGTRVQLMVSQAAEAGARTDFVAPGPQEFTDEPHLCLAVPPGALRPGTWQVMLHALAGARVDFSITLRMTSGTAHVGEGHEGWATLPEDVVGVAAGDIVERAGEPCS